MIKNFKKYSTENPMMIPINEGRGIPNILKEIINDVYDKVLYQIENPSSLISLDYNYDKFNIKNLYISTNNEKRKEIYAVSKFSIFGGEYLKSPSIYIYLDVNNFNKLDLKRVILHELLHIYEIFNRIKNKTKKDIQWGLNNSLLKLRDKYTNSDISDFIYMIYLSLDHEINARVAETYIILMDQNTDNRANLLKELKNTSAWKYKEYLSDYNIDVDISEFLNDLSNEMLKKYDNNFKIFKKNDTKYWIKLFKKKSKQFESKLLKIIYEVINDVNMLNSSYVDIDDSKNLSEKFITVYDNKLEEFSKLYKKNREY